MMNYQIEKILTKFEQGVNVVFITGKAGTGKSTLLRNFVEKVQSNIAVTAPTGVAALNINGETIHSFFRFRPSILPLEVASEAKKISSSSRAGVYTKLDVLIIDEISMVRADLLDCIDIFLKTIRKSIEPFGGVKLLLFGDLLQLPPVVTNSDKEYISNNYSNEYFFSSNSIQRLNDSFFSKICIFELAKVYRQSDDKFLKILNSIRTNTINDEDLTNLNKRVAENIDIDFENTIALVSKNWKANHINKLNLEKIESKSVISIAQKNGNFDEKLYPVPLELELKVGSRMIFCVNDSQNRFVNGQLGIIKEIIEEQDSTSFEKQKNTYSLIIEIIDTKENILLNSYTWEISKAIFNKATKKLDREIIGTFSQLPVMHAWAITIHKSQGKTFDKVFIDLSDGAFAHGQTYVALSRCRTLEGITLSNSIKKSDIIVDERVNDFIKNSNLEQL